MRIPERLKIGGHEYRVIYPYHFTERGDRGADHDFSTKVIRIDGKDSWSHEECPESGIAVMFLHEILHGCDLITGGGIFSGDDGEAKIERLSEALFQVLRDNKLDFAGTYGDDMRKRRACAISEG